MTINITTLQNFNRPAFKSTHIINQFRNCNSYPEGISAIDLVDTHPGIHDYYLAPHNVKGKENPSETQDPGIKHLIKQLKKSGSKQSVKIQISDGNEQKFEYADTNDFRRNFRKNVSYIPLPECFQKAKTKLAVNLGLSENSDDEQIKTKLYEKYDGARKIDSFSPGASQVFFFLRDEIYGKLKPCFSSEELKKYNLHVKPKTNSSLMEARKGEEIIKYLFGEMQETAVK